MSDFQNKKILILGFSLTGVACAKYFAQYKANVYVSEFNEIQEKDKTLVEELNSMNVHLEFGGHSDEFINNSEFSKYVYIFLKCQ